jgi:hypothetical protein
VARDIISQNLFGFAKDVTQHSIQKRLTVGNGNNPEGCNLPHVTRVQFRHSDVKPGSEPVPDLAQDGSLLLE